MLFVKRRGTRERERERVSERPERRHLKMKAPRTEAEAGGRTHRGETDGGERVKFKKAEADRQVRGERERERERDVDMQKRRE